MDDKPRSRRFRFGLISLFVLIAAVGVLAWVWNPFYRPPSRSNLRLIENGMTEAEVMALVGPPDYSACDSKSQLWHGYEIRPLENWVVVFADGKVVTNSPAKRSVSEIIHAFHECTELCLQVPDAKKCAREYVAELIEEGWSNGDANGVLNDVLGMLALVRANNAGPGQSQ